MRKDEENYLKYLFEKYFQKSGTTSTGYRLLVGAWVIEIIVVSIGFITAILMSTAANEQLKGTVYTGLLTQFTAVDIQIGLVFFIAALAELTKIPFCIGIYKSGKPFFRNLGLFFLLLVNILTIETILSGLDQAFAKRTLVIQSKQSELAAIEFDMQKPTENRKAQIQVNNAEISTYREQLAQIREDRGEREKAFDFRLESLRQQSVNPSVRKNISDRITSLEQDKTELDRRVFEITSSPCQGSTGILPSILTGEKSQCQQQDEQRDILNKKIVEIESQLENSREEINRLDIRSDKSNEGIIENLKKDHQERLNQIDDSANRVLSSIKSLENSNQTLTEGINKKTDDYNRNEEKVKTLREEINSLAIQNNLYRVAMLFKPSERNELKNLLSKLENNDRPEVDALISKYSKSNEDDSSLAYAQERKNIIDNKIAATRSRINELEASSFNTKSYYKINQDDLRRSFIYFWGVLGVIISLLGTALAFFGLHLSDPAMAEERIKPPNKISKFDLLLNSLRRALYAFIKRLRKPKIIIEKKEVIVEKEVEKIIYKDRVVTEYKTQEVPVEVIRKELIHVPMYTSDRSLLGKNLENDFSADDVKKFNEWKKKQDEKSDKDNENDS